MGNNAAFLALRLQELVESDQALARTIHKMYESGQNRKTLAAWSILYKHTYRYRESTGADARKATFDDILSGNAPKSMDDIPRFGQSLEHDFVSQAFGEIISCAQVLIAEISKSPPTDSRFIEIAELRAECDLAMDFYQSVLAYGERAEEGERLFAPTPAIEGLHEDATQLLAELDTRAEALVAKMEGRPISQEENLYNPLLRSAMKIPFSGKDQVWWLCEIEYYDS